MREQVLQNFNSVIETPYVSVTFGGYTFGLKNTINPVTLTRDIDYITNLTIKKQASGQVNMYTLTLVYVIKPGDDPNKIDKILGIDQTRKIVFSYGDLSQPTLTYRNEEAIITNVKPSIDVLNAKITYTITATSTVTLNYAIKRNYDSVVAQPSSQIFDLLYTDTSNGLLELFPGMADRASVEAKRLIARTDKVVQIEAQQNVSPLERLKSLVSQMQSSNNSFYGLVIHDYSDEAKTLDGQWFEVIDSSLRPEKYSLDVDIGYPSNTKVFDFQVNNDTSFALITKYSSNLESSRIINVNDTGNFEYSSDPSFVVRNGQPNEILKSWWKTMTSYPVSASLRIRGLIVPAILAETIRVNVIFFGRKYNYSGKYMVTGQTDVISTAGYRTTLDLLRIEGDEE